MKKIFCKLSWAMAAFFLFLSNKSDAQASMSGQTSGGLGFGFRVGLNYAKVRSDADSINYKYKPGLMVAVFLNPHHKGVIGSRHEFLYSRQGFQYTDSKGHSGTVSNDYLMIPQMMTINITKFVQLQAGAFAGYLLRSTDSDDQSSGSSGNVSYLSLMNRIDFGAAGGIEIHPIKGLILSARYNMGFTKLYKKQDNSSTTTATYNPSMYFLPYQNIDTKNAVLQFSAGFEF